MTSPTNAAGWRNRRKVNAAKREEFADAADIRCARQDFYAEQAEQGRAEAAAREKAEAVQECRCVACGGTGRQTVPDAMRTVAALHHFGFAGRSVSQAEIAALGAIALGVEPPAGLPSITFSYGSISPAPQAVSHRVETMEAVVMPKPAKPTKRVNPVEPETHDGFLLEAD